MTVPFTHLPNSSILCCQPNVEQMTGVVPVFLSSSYFLIPKSICRPRSMLSPFGSIWIYELQFALSI